MASQLQKLMFSIDLLDKVTGPAGRIKKTLGDVAESTENAYGKMRGGAAGVFAAGAALTMLAAPAHSLTMAMGEVESLGVQQSTLQGLANDAVDFSVKYGGSAAEVVRSSYDIQSAIAGLEGNDLASFTVSSGVLAKATKSDAATITDYMGTMYGIFNKSADSMGKSQWVTQLTGQTATAVQMFKTTGSEMASSFSSLGAAATSAGIAQANQMAILGSLQATMGGSEAGTKYSAFLQSVGGAQEELGMTFVDSQGNMLGMVNILDQLKGKFGDTIDVAEADALKAAFGSDEAVDLIKLLIPNTDNLATSIASIGNVTGMEKAEQMASSMVDPFEQWQAGISAVSTGLGSALLPVLYPLLSGMASASARLYKWTQAHPTLTKYIGYTVLGVTGLIAGVAALSIGMGLASMASAGFGLTMAIATSPITLTVLAIAGLTAGIVALVSNWDSVKTSLGDTAWGRMLVFTLEKTGSVFSWLWDFMKTGFLQIGQMVEYLFMPSINMVADGLSMIGDAANWFAEKFGFGDNESIPKTSPSLSAPNQLNSLKGGVSQHVANSINSSSNSNSNTTNIGTVTTSRPINMQEMSGMAMMAGA